MELIPPAGQDDVTWPVYTVGQVTRRRVLELQSGVTELLRQLAAERARNRTRGNRA